MWAKAFNERFRPDSDARLYLFLDGVEELKEDERKLLFNLLPKITANKLKIHILMACRPEIQAVVKNLRPTTIWITKDKIADDLQKIAAARVKTLPRLRKFSHATKRKIVQKLRENSDGRRD